MPSRVARGGRAAVEFIVYFGWGGICRVFFPILFLRTHTACCKYEATSFLITLSTSNETRPRERSYRGCNLPIGKMASSYRGAYRVSLFGISVGLVVRVRVTFVIFTDSESYTRPIPANLGSMEAGNNTLTRGTCFLACRLVLDAGAGLLWI